MASRMAGSPRPQPALELEDRVAAVGDRALPGAGHEERPHLLDRVARVRDAQRLADDLIEIDEDLAPQQVVELVLARGVLRPSAA